MVDPDKYRLNADELNLAYQSIRGIYLSGGSALKFPRFIVVSAQTGAGKSTIFNIINDQFSASQEPVHVDMDELRRYAKKRKAFQYQPFKTALLTNHDAWEFTSRLLDEAKAGRRNVIYETALKSIDDVAAMIQTFQVERYAADFHAIAVNSKMSILGIFKRYEETITERKPARFVDIAYHDAVYQAFPHSVERLETTVNLDLVTVYRRSGEILYSNSQSGSPARAKSIIQSEHDRTWSDAEKNSLVKGWQEVMELIRNRSGIRTKPAWYVRLAENFQKEAILFAQSTQSIATDPLNAAEVEAITHHHIFTRPKNGSVMHCFDRRLHKIPSEPK